MPEEFFPRPLPNSYESEQLIIGNILLDNELITQCIESLSPEEFYSPIHRRVYAAMIEAFNTSQLITPIILGEILKKDGSLESIGGVTAITALTIGIPYVSDLTSYIELVKAKALSRQVIRVSNTFVANALSEELQGLDLVNQCEAELFSLSQGSTRTELVNTIDLVATSVEQARLIGETGQRTIGLSTGFIDWDERTLGLHRAELSILAARPSMGKTALALNISQHAAYRGHAVVGFFSLEMSAAQLTERLICSECQINSHQYRTGALNEEMWQRVRDFQARMADSKLFIDDAPAITTSYLRAKLRRLFYVHHQLDLVVIDYLQLMTGNSDSREREIAQISRDLKSISKEFDVPVLATAQLNRSPEQRANHRPNLSDLRESGQIEQDADAVFGLFRDDYYNQEPATYTNIGEVIILKQRNGPTGAINLQYTPETSTFRNLAAPQF